MNQLSESNIPFEDRLIRLREAICAGCTPAELLTDLEVALSVRGWPVASRVLL